MLKLIFWTSLAICAAAALAPAAERHFDFSQFAPGQCPTGFVSTVTGEGKPGQWKIIEDEVPPMLRSLSPLAQNVAKRPVLAQTARDATDEHFPLLLLQGEEFGDFTLSTRFKIADGDAERMAGLAFRARDEKNYYVLRASALGNNIRFYKFIDGRRTPPIGNNIPVQAGVWHDLKVQCRGNEIKCFFNGKECMPPLNDNSFGAGKIGFWTKSDSVSYFADTHIDYTPRVRLAEVMVADMMKRYPRLRALRIYASTNSEPPQIIASSIKSETGLRGADIESEVFRKAEVRVQKAKKSVDVLFPLRDRNGEVAGVVKVTMRPVLAEPTNSTIARAAPIRRKMEDRLKTADSLLE